MPPAFHPQGFLRHPHVQTVLASVRLGRGGGLAESAAAEVRQDAAGVCLQARINRQTGARGLVLTLPGWYGSSESGYNLSLARSFWDRGWDVVRLNPRDHGGTEPLNEQVYHAARLEELRQAVAEQCARVFPQPVFLVGFSLGGNAALRIALNHPPDLSPNLMGLAVISPVLDPAQTSLQVDQGLALYRIYLMRKWKRSLAAKARAFPSRYDFSNLLRHEKIMPLTEALIPFYSEFRSAAEYFNAYTLTRDSFRDLAYPATLVMAEDDPVVPFTPFRNLAGIKNLDTCFTARGGHCGFFSNLKLDVWAHQAVLEKAEALLAARLGAGR